MTPNETWKRALTLGAGAATLSALLTLLIDPTAGPGAHLARLEPTRQPAMSGRRAAIDTAGLANAPIFVMTSGPAAYKAQEVQVFGISISPKRKAALVGIGGAAPVWLEVGEKAGDLRLTDVGTNGVNFDTPVGPRVVELSATQSTGG